MQGNADSSAAAGIRYTVRRKPQGWQAQQSKNASAKGRIILNLDGENKSEFAEMKEMGKKGTEFGLR